MNCQEVIAILDDANMGRLDAAQRRQAEAHVAVCADCARAWHAHASLATLPDKALTTEFANRCRAAVVASGARATRTRFGGRMVIVGSLVALAAAALVLLSVTTDRGEPEAAAQVVQVEATPMVEPAETAAVPDVVPAVASLPVTEADAAPRFTVWLMPPDPVRAEQEARAHANDPDASRVMQLLRATLASELHKVPGLAVLDDDPTGITPARRHFRLLVSTARFVGFDGKSMYEGQQYPVHLGVQELRPGGSVVDHRLPMAGFVVDPHASCVVPDDVEGKLCDAPMTAAYMVDYLRRQVFPPDPSVALALQARLQNVSLSPAERFEVLVELLKLQARLAGSDLTSDSEVVRAVIELARASDPAQRARVWRAMRGVGDPLLVEPLLASLQQDPQDVRMAAIEALAAGFSGDRRARSALEAAAVSDPEPLVRAVARRGLHGEEDWRAYVASSLKDSSRSGTERVEALIYDLYPRPTIESYSGPSPANFWDVVKGLDDESVQSVADVFLHADTFRGSRGNPGNNFLANFAATHIQNPVVTELLLTVLAEDSQALNRAVAAQVLAQARSSDPEVRDALLRAVKDDPDVMVRDTLGQILKNESVKKAMERAAQ